MYYSMVHSKTILDPIHTPALLRTPGTSSALSPTVLVSTSMNSTRPRDKIIQLIQHHAHPGFGNGKAHGWHIEIEHLLKWGNETIPMSTSWPQQLLSIEISLIKVEPLSHLFDETCHDMLWWNIEKPPKATMYRDTAIKYILARIILVLDDAQTLQSWWERLRRCQSCWAGSLLLHWKLACCPPPPHASSDWNVFCRYLYWNVFCRYLYFDDVQFLVPVSLPPFLRHPELPAWQHARWNEWARSAIDIPCGWKSRLLRRSWWVRQWHGSLEGSNSGPSSPFQRDRSKHPEKCQPQKTMKQARNLNSKSRFSGSPRRWKWKEPFNTFHF